MFNKFATFSLEIDSLAIFIGKQFCYAAANQKAYMKGCILAP